MPGGASPAAGRRYLSHGAAPSWRTRGAQRRRIRCSRVHKAWFSLAFPRLDGALAAVGELRRHARLADPILQNLRRSCGAKWSVHCYGLRAPGDCTSYRTPSQRDPGPSFGARTSPLRAEKKKNAPRRPHSFAASLLSGRGAAAGLAHGAAPRFVVGSTRPPVSSRRRRKQPKSTRSGRLYSTTRPAPSAPRVRRSTGRGWCDFPPRRPRQPRLQRPTTASGASSRATPSLAAASPSTVVAATAMGTPSSSRHRRRPLRSSRLRRPPAASGATAPTRPARLPRHHPPRPRLPPRPHLASAHTGRGRAAPPV